MENIELQVFGLLSDKKEMIRAYKIIVGGSIGPLFWASKSEASFLFWVKFCG